MIHKVNRPSFLNMDPGSSQGSGVSYDGPGESGAQPQKQDSPAKDNGNEPKTQNPHLSLVVSVEQAGMTEVVKDLLEQKQLETPVVQPGLSIRYSADASPVKGLLLNRKAE